MCQLFISVGCGFVIAISTKMQNFSNPHFPQLPCCSPISMQRYNSCQFSFSILLKKKISVLFFPVFGLNREIYVQ